MKLALIFLSIFVAISHQQYYGHPRMMFAFPWLAVPSSQEPVFFGHNYDYAAAAKEDVYPEVENNQHILTGEEDEEQEEFADTHQSRIKGISRYRPRLSFQDQQNARFLFNLFASTTGAFNNPLLKTATFTSTLTVTTISSVVTCVPSFQFDKLGIPAPPVCAGRKKRHLTGEEESDDEVNQFPIVPSETLKLMPTAISSSDLTILRENRLPITTDEETNFHSLTSSRDDIVSDQVLIENRNSKQKRFFSINKNIFVVSSTVTTYTFVPRVLTETINLVVPAPAIACVLPACALCIPPGYIICPA